MRNLISGIVGTVLGGLILLGLLLRGGIQGEGAYRAGQIGGLACGAVFLVAGLVYLYLGLTGLGDGGRGPVPRKRPRRLTMAPRPRRQQTARHEDEEEAGAEALGDIEDREASRGPGPRTPQSKYPWLVPVLLIAGAVVLVCGTGGVIAVILAVSAGSRSRLPSPSGGGTGVESSDSGKAASVVLSNASVTRDRIGVQVAVNYRVEVPRKSEHDQFYLILKTPGKTYDEWIPDAELQAAGRLKKWFAHVRPEEQAGPFELYLELRQFVPAQRSDVVSNRLKVEVR